MSLSAMGTLLKPQTSLQQLLNDINFQRNKEMRQLLKDDSGFVVLQGTNYWTDLFVRYFLFQIDPKQNIDSDDLLFFVRKKHVKSSSRHMPKYKTEVDVFRKDSRKLPIGDPDVDWEETVYLNMVIHQFDYILTLAICTRTSPKELQVLRRHSQRVYASPSRRKMDTKGDGEEITYPHICFMVDNFDEVFNDILVRDGEMVCVELVANDKDGVVQGVIFLGSIRYDVLKKVYDARQSSLSSKVAHRMSLGLFSSGSSVQTRCEFVRMKGPQGKGHAEMAVTKPKGSGVETPTSEPGFCATDMWDDEWNEESDEYFMYGHQRRLSDPSANINNYLRYKWRNKDINEETNKSYMSAAKAQSENEGLDSLANEIMFIEAGDLRDDEPSAFSVSQDQNLSNSTYLKENIDTMSSNIITQTDNILNSKSNIIKSEAKTELDTLQMPQCRDELLSISAAYSPTMQYNDSMVTIETMTTTITLDLPEVNDKTTGCVGGCFKSGHKCMKKKHWPNTEKNAPEMLEIHRPTCSDFVNATQDCLNKIEDISHRKSKKQTNKPNITTVSKRNEPLINNKFNYSQITTGITHNRLNRSSSLSAADQHKIRINFMSANMNKKDKLNTKPKTQIKTNDKHKKQNESEEAMPKSCETNNKTNLLAKLSPKRIKPLRSQCTVDRLNKKSKTLNKKTIITTVKNKLEEKKNPVIKKHSAICKVSNNKPQKEDETHIKKELTNEVTNLNKDTSEYEIADDAMTLSNARLEFSQTTAEIFKASLEDTKDLINVQGKEELPIETKDHLKNDKNLENTIVTLNDNSDSKIDCEKLSKSMIDNKYVNFPKQDLPIQVLYNLNRGISIVPKRRTPDGTNIYYWCDIPKKILKELDDGIHNPLWAIRGFAQSFHFWKENKRQQSTPLNAFLTYVTLPWWSIAKDILDHRETPILTF